MSQDSQAASHAGKSPARGALRAAAAESKTDVAQSATVADLYFQRGAPGGAQPPLVRRFSLLFSRFSLLVSYLFTVAAVCPNRIFFASSLMVG